MAPGVYQTQLPLMLEKALAEGKSLTEFERDHHQWAEYTKTKNKNATEPMQMFKTERRLWRNYHCKYCTTYHT